mmetsp:Transcript_19639/g.48612  ORF Transcript_19639/g.48612 Transcript_19639/m.48612 type:complete len:193 (-) Transcript_19639:309-887(-)
MRRFAQVLCKAGAAAVARAAPSPLPVVRATLDAVGRQAAPAAGAGFAASRTYSSGVDKPLTALADGDNEGDDGYGVDVKEYHNYEHATGIEQAELDAESQGIDYFDHHAFLTAPFGTEENPCVVESIMPWRIVGGTDPDDDSIVHWGLLEAGEPPMKIGQEWFVHKAAGIDGHKPVPISQGINASILTNPKP